MKHVNWKRGALALAVFIGCLLVLLFYRRSAAPISLQRIVDQIEAGTQKIGKRSPGQTLQPVTRADNIESLRLNSLL